MAGKEVAKVEPAEIATFDGDVLAEMERAAAAFKGTLDLNSDVRLPQLRMVQATTQGLDGANPGQLWDTLMNTPYDAAHAIVLQMWKTRALFSGGAIGDPPNCSSGDGITGVGDPGGDCLSCPHAKWQKGGRCQLRYNYLMMLVGDEFDPENELPRGVMMHGTSAKVASRLNTMLLGAKFPWSNVLKLSSTTEKNDKGQYKVWDVARDRPATQEEQLLAFEWYKRLGAAASVTIEGDDNKTAATPTESSDEIPF